MFGMLLAKKFLQGVVPKLQYLGQREREIHTVCLFCFMFDLFLMSKCLIL